MPGTERSERGGVTLDSGEGPEDITSDGGDISAAIKENTKANDVINEPSGESDLNGGTEVHQDGEVDGQPETETNENSEIPGQGQQDQVEAIKEIIRAEFKNNQPAIPAPTTPKLTEEDWGKLEQEWGQPRQTIERITNQNVMVINKLMEYIDSKFSKIESGDAIQSVARDPKFTDASKYRKEISEFLQDYDSKHWTNPQLIQRAIYYARGLNSGTNIQKVRSEVERNKKIAGTGRPSSPSSGMKRTSMPALSGAHREVANLMGGESEFNKYKSRPSRQIE